MSIKPMVWRSFTGALLRRSSVGSYRDISRALLVIAVQQKQYRGVFKKWVPNETALANPGRLAGRYCADVNRRVRT